MVFVEFNINALVGYGALGIFILLSFGIPCGYLGILFLVSAYVFYQWTFWFPDGKDLILKEQLKKTPNENPSLVGLCGISKTPMRPSGKVLIDKHEYEAYL